jgi:hypothetical protein
LLGEGCLRTPTKTTTIPKPLAPPTKPNLPPIPKRPISPLQKLGRRVPTRTPENRRKCQIKGIVRVVKRGGMAGLVGVGVGEFEGEGVESEGVEC